MAGNKSAAKNKAKAKAKALSQASRTDTQAVTRVLGKEWRGWSAASLSTQGPDGKTPLTAVKEAVAQAREDRQRIMPELWAALRLRYRSVQDDFSGRAAVINRHDPVAPQLQEAFAAMNSGHTVRKALENLHIFSIHVAR